MVFFGEPADFAGEVKSGQWQRLRALVCALEPVLEPGPFAFVSVPFTIDLRGLDIVASVREAEGLSLVLPEAQAIARDHRVLFRAARVTLTVASDLDAVGLTAVVAMALARAGLPCNVVAGAVHDHLFVPVDAADRAMQELRQLQRHWQAL